MPTLDEAILGETPRDPLDAAIDGLAGDKRRANLYHAVKQNPDEHAQAVQLSRTTGLPVPVVARNLPQVRQRAEMDALDSAIEQSPAVRRGMDDPNFAILARDDVETLAEIERTANRRSGGAIGGPAFARQAELKASRGPEATFSSVLSGIFKSLPQGAEATRQGIRAQFADVIGSPEMSAEALRRYERAQGATFLSTPEFESDTARGVYSGLTSLIRQTPGVAASIALRTPLPGLGLIGAQTKAEAYAKYRSRGATPGQAFAGGVGEGATEVATELLPMGFLVSRFGKVGAGQFLTGLLAREVPSEQIATLVQDAIDTAVANPDKTWEQYIAERPGAAYQTLVATVTQAGAMGAINEVARRVAGPTFGAEAATQDAQAIQQLAALAAASKLRTHDPQTFQDFVESAAPGQEVYLDARTLQQAGIDVQALAQASPTVAAQIEEALATGGDLVIPMAEYATRIAGTDLDPVLTPHLRSAEDALSLDEAQRFYQGQAEEFQRAAAQVMEEKAADDAWTTSAKAVEAKLFEELRSTKRFTDDVNTAYATLMRDFYVTTAARLGVTPEEMFARYPIKVAAERAVADARMEQLSPEQVMRLNIPLKMPSGAEFDAAVAGTPAARVTPDGLLVDVVRYQKPEQEGAQSARTGVFYLPKGSPQEKYYRGGKTDYGGVEKHEGTTLLRAPLFVKGATGGKAPQVAYDQIKGKGAYEKMRSDVLREPFYLKAEYGKTLAVAELLQKYGADESLAAEIVRTSRTGNTLPYAVQENIVAHAVRDAGYDSVVGYSKGKAGPFISEVFDVREQTYPARGMESQVHPTFEQAPNPLQRLAQSISRALGLQQEQAGGGEVVGGALDVGEFFSQPRQEGNRAEIAFGKDITQTPSVITLFQNADLSSFLHEMGHFQLEVLANIASQPNAPAEIVADMDAVLKWFGVPDLATWRSMSLEERRPHHEAFARGFESYLFEGKAPSQELNSLFARFRAWLINVYKSVKALNVEISDDIRGVMDRLLATDEAIKQAEAARGMTPLFPDDPEANALAAEATQAATAELQKRSLRDMRWLDNARGRLLKQMQADAKTKRQAVEGEVRAEVRQMPVYAAQRFLRYGELPTGEKVTGAKLDIAALKEMYGEGTAAPWRYLSTGTNGLAGVEGLTPDQFAEMVNSWDGMAGAFTSGDHLVREILAAAPEAQMIEGMTDQRVLERYGDLSSPDALARAVDEAIHNEARARFIATELKAVTQAAGPVRTITQAAKAFAEATIARKKVKDIKPKQHAAAETRAAKAAEKAMASGDTTLAASEKRNQLIQNYSTRAAYDALDEIERAVKYLRNFDAEGTRKNLDDGYLDQIDQLLERFDLRAGVSNKDAAKRESLMAWVESQREQGFEPDIPPELIDSAMRKPYRELTLEELRGLVDTVKQVEHLGRLKHKLLTAKDEREFRAIRDEIAASIEDNAKGVRELRTRDTLPANAAKLGRQFLALHRKMASVAREMDGFADGGPVWEYFIRAMNTAGDRETTMRAEATAKLYALVKPLVAQGKMGGKGIYFDSLGMSLNREERIAIALNLGNAGNMQRLLDGEGWTPVRLKPVLDTITAEEADFVQAVWDFFESYRPEIAAKERRIYGKEPAWVEPQPITLGGRQLRGGYYPIKYDAARSGRAEAHADAEAARQQMRGAYTTATTRRSFTKSRAEEVTGRPLLYSFAGIYQGTNEVIHDLAWHEWLIDSNRLLRALDGPIRTYYGAETVGVFKKAIEDIAAGDVPAQNVFEKGINHLRMGATVAGLGWNLSTALLQPFGLTQSMVRIGPAWVAKGLGQWLKAPFETGEEVRSRSAFMASRAKTMQREINEIQNQVRASKLDPIRSTFFLMIQKMQMVADMPTWLGAYEKAIAAGEAEDRAVALADQAVVDAQGGGQTKDLAQIQRGTPALKLWTNFYSFFNVTYNLAIEKTKEKGGDVKLYPSLALDYLLLFTIPAAMVTLLKAALAGEDDEDELAKKLAADQISYLLGTMIGLREVTAAAQKLAGVEQFKSNYGGPAGLRFFQEVDKLATQQAQGEYDAAWFKAADNVAGTLLHYPSGQINRTVEGAAALIEGKTSNPAALAFGPPKP